MILCYGYPQQIRAVQPGVPIGHRPSGRCVLSRLIYGIRPALGLALLTMLGTIALGALLGVMAGYFRGVVEEIIMRVVE